MPDKPAPFALIARVLHRHISEYVTAAATAAALRCTPASAFDADPYIAENVERLVAALRAIRACYCQHIGKLLEQRGAR